MEGKRFLCLYPFSGLIVDYKSAGPPTSDRTKDVKVDADTQTPAVRVLTGPALFAQMADIGVFQASNITVIAKQSRPQRVPYFT